MTFEEAINKRKKLRTYDSLLKYDLICNELYKLEIILNDSIDHNLGSKRDIRIKNFILDKSVDIP